MNGETWTSYEFQRAPTDFLCQFRREDGFTHIGYAKDFLPEFNISGLEWKLTGIAREQLDGMPEEFKRQVMPPAGLGWFANILLSPYANMAQFAGFGCSGSASALW